MKFDEALQQLSAGRKATRLRVLLPAIEQKLAEGTTHREILRLLNDSGFELTERTYKSYLYRYRKRRRCIGQAPIAARLIERLTSPTASGALTSTPAQSVASDQGPNTFEFNAGGLPPELLK